MDSAITLSEITGTSALMVAHGVLIQILILTKKGSKNNPGYYSKSAPATILNSFCNSASHSRVYSTLKARGQVTIAGIVKVVTIHSNHDKSL